MAHSSKDQIKKPGSCASQPLLEWYPPAIFGSLYDTLGGTSRSKPEVDKKRSGQINLE